MTIKVKSGDRDAVGSSTSKEYFWELMLDQKADLAVAHKLYQWLTDNWQGTPGEEWHFFVGRKAEYEMQYHLGAVLQEDKWLVQVLTESKDDAALLTLAIDGLLDP